MELYIPISEAAIGNLSLSMATHFMLAKNPGFHPDVYKYGRDKFIKCKHVTDQGEIKGYNAIFGSMHLEYPNIGEVMRDIIQPTDTLQKQIDEAYEKVKHCVAGFHIRRGTMCKDSARYGYLPFASDEAVESMINEANFIHDPVLIMSDSVSTKEYFLSKVPKAVSLDLPIGFTACEHSQKVEVEDEDHRLKMNSFVEWFIMSKMSTIYMTNGGVYRINMPTFKKEGLTSTFGYSAALYGGITPHYVFNDGFIFYPNGQNKPNHRYVWSDPFNTKKYVSMKPDKENIERAKKYLPMWNVLLSKSECTEEYEGVKYIEDGIRASIHYETLVEEGDDEMIRKWVIREGQLREGVSHT
jgi:hypothetical protein